MVVVKGITDFPRSNDRLKGYLDIWWIVRDGGILMLIAYLLKQHKVWKGCKMRVYAISQTEEQNEKIKKALQRHIYLLRIDASVFIVNMTDLDSIDDDAVQKTLNMEQRTRTLALLKKNLSTLSTGGISNEELSKNDVQQQQPQQICQSTINETSFIQKTFEGIDENQDTLNNSDQISLKNIDDVKIKKMSSAVRLNQVILEYSTESQLVLLSLPKPPKSIKALVENYLAYVEALTEGLPRIMLIGGSGQEVITAEP